MAAPMAPMSKDSDFKEIKGRLVVSVRIGEHDASNAAFHWRLVVITPDQKRISFPFFDNGTIQHTETIKHLKKGNYEFVLINDDLLKPVNLFLQSRLVDIKYEFKKGKFFNELSETSSFGTLLQVGQMFRVPYTVFAPAHRSLPLQ